MLRMPELKLKRMLEKKEKTERKKPKPEEEKKILLSRRENSKLFILVLTLLISQQMSRINFLLDLLKSKKSFRSLLIKSRQLLMLKQQSNPKNKPIEKPRKPLIVKLEKLRNNGSMTKLPLLLRLTSRVRENTRMLKTKLRSTEKFFQP
jgi:hypothetical protein